MESGHEVIITLFATIQLHLKFSTSLGDPLALARQCTPYLNSDSPEPPSYFPPLSCENSTGMRARLTYILSAIPKQPSLLVSIALT